MKCQHCEKPATFHITELTEPNGPSVLHLCEEHARTFLSNEGTATPASALSSMLAKQLKIKNAAEELATADKKTCPICGITFADFRKFGRLGCAYDYIAFEDDLQPLLVNIHGSLQHVGKEPSNQTGSPERQHRIMQLKVEMKEAVEKEDYETASRLRDKISEVESGNESSWSKDALEDLGDDFQSETPIA